MPGAITTGPDGNVWFAEYSSGLVGRITPDGKIKEFPLPSGNCGPSGIAAGPDGNLWVTEAIGKIARITPAGAAQEFPITPAGGLTDPGDITAGPDGNLWFSDYLAGAIGRCTPNGSINEYAIPTANSKPIGIAAGADGNIWFTEHNTNKVGELNPAGPFFLGEFNCPDPSNSPSEIAAGPDGNLWACAGGSQVIRITTGGTISVFSTPTFNGIPHGITAGPDGNVWFGEYNSNKVGRLNPDGSFSEFSVPAANGDPSAITTGPDGALWFCEQNSDMIGRLGLLTAAGLPQTVSVGAPSSGNVAFLQSVDPGARASDFAAIVGWGDGTSSPGTVIGSAKTIFGIGAEHTYKQVGSYTATVTVTNVNDVGTGVIGAIPPTPSSVTASFPVTVGSATHLAFLQQPSSEFAGQPLSPAVSVAVEDTNNHILTGDNSTITLSLAGNAFAATLTGTLSAPAVNGIATFSNVAVNRAGTGLTLLAADGSLTGAQSAPINITALDVTVGSDNQTRLLGDNVDGRARVQTISNAFQVSNTGVNGPIAGWTAQRAAAGSDGLTRLLWTSVDGSYAVWLLNASNVPVAEPNFPALPGETAIDVAVGTDNKARLLWDYNDGRAVVGTMDNAGNVSNVQVFGKPAGWSGARLAVGSDGVTRLLWTHTSGAFAIWLLDANNNFQSSKSFGPFANLTGALDIAVAPDNKSRVLLQGSAGQPVLWTIDSNGTISNQQTLGPSPGYLPSGLASGADGLTRLVWDNQDGSVALYLLNADNTYSAGTSFGPWLPGAAAQKLNNAPDFTGPAVLLVPADTPAPAHDAPVSPAAPAPGAPPSSAVTLPDVGLPHPHLARHHSHKAVHAAHKESGAHHASHTPRHTHHRRPR